MCLKWLTLENLNPIMLLLKSALKAYDEQSRQYTSPLTITLTQFVTTREYLGLDRIIAMK